MEETASEPAPRRLGHSLAAVLVGFLLIVVLSIVTDQVFHALDVYPPWGQPMREPALNLLALSYRIVYGVLGSYVAAKLAPRAPMRHALVLGYVGLVISAVGGYVANREDLSPIWFPIALVLTAVPCAWLGGALHRPGASSRP